MEFQTALLVLLAATWCGACGSPSAPSVETVYDLRITESPSCPAFAAPIPGDFFQFGTMTIHVKGSFSAGAFLMVDDSLAVFGAPCSNTSRPTLLLTGSSVGTGTISGRLDGGLWSRSSCVGTYFGAQGTVSGMRDGTSAGGLLDGTLRNGIFALNNQGFCTATDHTWSLKPVGVQP
jgi:hypothetical protein